MAPRCSELSFEGIFQTCSRIRCSPEAVEGGFCFPTWAPHGMERQDLVREDLFSPYFSEIPFLEVEKRHVLSS